MRELSTTRFLTFLGLGSVSALGTLLDDDLIQTLTALCMPLALLASISKSDLQQEFSWSLKGFLAGLLFLSFVILLVLVLTRYLAPPFLMIPLWLVVAALACWRRFHRPAQAASS